MITCTPAVGGSMRMLCFAAASARAAERLRPRRGTICHVDVMVGRSSGSSPSAEGPSVQPPGARRVTSNSGGASCQRPAIRGFRLASFYRHPDSTGNSAGTARRMGKPRLVLVPRQLLGAELRQMRGDELGVEQPEPAEAQPRDEVHQRHLRGVAREAEHALAEEHAADGDAIEAADQVAVAGGSPPSGHGRADAVRRTAARSAG